MAYELAFTIGKRNYAVKWGGGQLTKKLIMTMCC